MPEQSSYSHKTSWLPPNSNHYSPFLERVWHIWSGNPCHPELWPLLLVPYLFHVECCHSDSLHHRHLSRNHWHYCLASIFLRGSVEMDGKAFCVPTNNIGAFTKVLFPRFSTVNTDVLLYIHSLASSYCHMIIQHLHALQVPTSNEVHDAGDECSS